jgi:TolA-binding protein
MVWKPGYVKPGRKMFELATQRSRHVLLTGDGDMNREQTHVYFDGFVKEGFKHITYVEIPKFGHQMPNKEWFAKGLALLEPIEEIAVEEPKAKTAKAKPAVTRAAPVASTPGSEADRLLSSAKVYVTNRRYEGARKRLKELVEKYPSTAAAEAGRKLLKEIEGK